MESFYRRRGLLLDFEITGGIPETWPRLLQALGVQRSGGTEALRPSSRRTRAVALPHASNSQQLHSDSEAEGGRKRRQAVASV